MPEPWQKAPAKIVQAFQNAREYHVSMNHYAHANKPDPRTGKRVACVACHAVDAGFKLQRGTPGHAQCAGCHTKDVPGHTMADCGKCHTGPSRAEYFAAVAAERGIKNASRPATTVRACEGEGVLEYERGRKVSCFTHERPGHRLAKDGSAVQCESCHYIVTDRSKWRGKDTYESLADLHFNSVIFPAVDRDPSGNTQHKACGGGGACHEHAKAVVDGRQCFLCHANKSPF